MILGTGSKTYDGILKSFRTKEGKALLRKAVKEEKDPGSPDSLFGAVASALDAYKMTSESRLLREWKINFLLTRKVGRISF